MLIVQRKAWVAHLSDAVLGPIERLLGLVYKYVEQWRSCFDYGMRDWTYQVTDFRSGPAVTDAMLNGLTEMVVALGGKTPDGGDRWHFCNLFLPQDTSLPLQQRILEVRAHSTHAPVEVSTMRLYVARPGLTFRAYQTGHGIYRPRVMPSDLAYRELEESTHSAIALPIAGEDGLAVASAYIASDEIEAFSKEDQRTLKMINGLIEDLVATYKKRREVKGDSLKCDSKS